MSFVRNGRTTRARPALCVGVLALAGLTLVAVGARGRPPGPAAPEPAVSMVPTVPELKDTPANLQAAFNREINTHARYRAYAEQADREGFADAARLLRACATAESVHARRFAQAIAWTGQPARAVLERLVVGGTAENLRAAIDGETYEIGTWYPALLARARSDHQSMAVRSLTLALGSERGHLQLLTRALERLEQHPPVAEYFVCPYCGRTTDVPVTGKCPACFTSASRFLEPA